MTKSNEKKVGLQYQKAYKQGGNKGQGSSLLFSSLQGYLKNNFKCLLNKQLKTDNKRSRDNS